MKEPLSEDQVACMACLEPMPHKHPFCNTCGWRKGGIDSWDGKRCKCGFQEPALLTEAEAWREVMRGWIRDIAVEYEPTTPCECAIGTGPVLYTGHRQSCPVDQAVRLDLAKGGIV